MQDYLHLIAAMKPDKKNVEIKHIKFISINMTTASIQQNRTQKKLFNWYSKSFFHVRQHHLVRSSNVNGVSLKLPVKIVIYFYSNKLNYILKVKQKTHFFLRSLRHFFLTRITVDVQKTFYFDSCVFQSFYNVNYN